MVWTYLECIRLTAPYTLTTMQLYTLDLEVILQSHQQTLCTHKLVAREIVYIR
jgi:hypothetical protein